MESSALTNMVMRPVGPGVFELGKVKFDKQERTVTFPAVVNMRGGPIEYFLVTTYGKTHESIFRTDAEPYHIHLAMLLLDAQGAGTNAPVPGGGGPIEQPGLPPIKGDQVALEVSWKVDGKPVRHAADSLVFNQAERAVMTRGTWVYNGSAVMDGLFVAQRDGSIVSLIADPYALMNNPRPGRENDEIWTTQTNSLPEVNTPVEITIKLESGQRQVPASRCIRALLSCWRPRRGRIQSGLRRKSEAATALSRLVSDKAVSTLRSATAFPNATDNSQMRRHESEQVRLID